MQHIEFLAKSKIFLKYLQAKWIISDDVKCEWRCIKDRDMIYLISHSAVTSREARTCLENLAEHLGAFERVYSF